MANSAVNNLTPQQVLGASLNRDMSAPRIRGIQVSAVAFLDDDQSAADVWREIIIQNASDSMSLFIRITDASGGLPTITEYTNASTDGFEIKPLGQFLRQISSKLRISGKSDDGVTAVNVGVIIRDISVSEMNN